jgi:hypothetical protein
MNVGLSRKSSRVSGGHQFLIMTRSCRSGSVHHDAGVAGRLGWLKSNQWFDFSR